jgi:hypothetical protein
MRTRLATVTIACAAAAAALFGAQVGAATIAAGSTGHRGASGFDPLYTLRIGSSSDVIVVGTRSCAKEPCLEILLTTNDGKTFTKLGSPPITRASNGSIGPGSLDGLVFANAQDGYAIEQRTGLSATTLYATFDGGRTWHPEPLDPRISVEAEAATAHRFYFVLAACTRRDQPPCTWSLAVSRAGASGWTTLPFPEATQINKDGFAAVGSRLGVWGHDVWISLQWPRQVLAVSHDEGNTFTLLSDETIGSVAGCSLTAESADQIWAECPTGMQVSFARSDDGGAHFGVLRIPGAFYGTGGGDFTPVTGSVAYFYNMAKYLWRDVVNPFELYRTTDGGRSFTPVGRLPLPSGWLVFTSRDDGLAVGYPPSGPRVLMRTADGGRHWQAAAT